MQPKQENEPANVLPATYESPPPEYKAYNPTEKQKRSLERLINKKRSKRS